MRYGLGTVYIKYNTTLVNIEVQNLIVNFYPVRYEVCGQEDGTEVYQDTNIMKIEIEIRFNTVQKDIVNTIRTICNSSSIYYYPDYVGEPTIFFEVFGEESFSPLQQQAGYSGVFTLKSKEPQLLTLF